jgi:hypothetical protein
MADVYGYTTPDALTRRQNAGASKPFNPDDAAYTPKNSIFNQGLSAPQYAVDGGIARRSGAQSQLAGPYADASKAVVDPLGIGAGIRKPTSITNPAETVAPAETAVDMTKQYDPQVTANPNVQRASAIQPAGGVIRGQGIGGDENLRRALIEAQYGAGQGSPSMRAAIMQNYMQGNQQRHDADLATQKVQADSFDRAQTLNLASEEQSNDRAQRASAANADTVMKRRAAEAAANDPMHKLDIMAKMQGIQVTNADQARKNAEFDAGIQGKIDANWNNEIDAIVKSGASRDDAEKQVYANHVAAGDDVSKTTLGRRFTNTDSETTREGLNNGTSWLADAGSGIRSGVPFDNAAIPDDAVLDVNKDIQYSDPGGVVGNVINPLRRVLGKPRLIDESYAGDVPEGMDAPHRYVEENDPSVLARKVKNRQPRSGL